MIAAEGLTAVRDMIGIYRKGGRCADDYQVAWLTVALKDMRIRDDAWARMDPGNSQAHQRLWTDVVKRAQPGHVAAPASLLAFVAWQTGDGALANLALDLALADDPDYSMAGLLRQVISAGAPPSMARLPMTPRRSPPATKASTAMTRGTSSRTKSMTTTKTKIAKRRRRKKKKKKNFWTVPAPSVTQVLMTGQSELG
jgi:hypothetical protein